MDDAFAVQDAHGSCNLMQEHSDGIFTESAFSWQKRSHVNIYAQNQTPSAHAIGRTEELGRTWRD